MRYKAISDFYWLRKTMNCQKSCQFLIKKGNLYDLDEGVRADSSIEKLGKLKPAFDKPFGTVTPGNSSQITDGAASLVLASAEAVRKT